MGILQTLWNTIRGGGTLSRGILWCTFFFPVTFLTLALFPSLPIGLDQMSDVVHPEWVAGQGDWAIYILYPTWAIAFWLFATARIWQLASFIRDPNKPITAKPDGGKGQNMGKKFLWWMFRWHTFVFQEKLLQWETDPANQGLLNKPEHETQKRKAVTGSFILTTSALGMITLGIPILFVAFSASQNEYFPRLALWILSFLLVHSGVNLSILHLGVNSGRHFLSLSTLVPLGLVFLGFASVDWWAKALTWTFLAVMCLLPPLSFVFALGLKGFKKVCLVGAGVGLFALVICMWNWGDIRRFWSEDEDQLSSTDIVPIQQSKFTPRVLPTKSGDKSRSLPPVLMNFGGGGTRAAMFNATILTEIWFTKTQWSSLGPREQDYLLSLHPSLLEILTDAPITQSDPEDVYLGRLMLIGASFVSSVSGGSVTSAVWNKGVFEIAANIKLLFPSMGVEPVLLRARALKLFFQGSDSHKKIDRIKDLFANEFVPDESGKSASQLKAEKEERDEERRKLFDDYSFTKRMKVNLLASTILGLFNPEGSRSEEIRKALDSPAVGLKGVALQDLRDFEESGVLPASIFNATLTTTGERFAITNLASEWFWCMSSFGPQPLNSHKDRRHLNKEDLLPPVNEDARFSARPGAVVVNSLLLPKWNPPLSMAVWASSDFPYGFPVNRMRHGEAQREVGSLDGGLIDNVGVNSTASLLRSIFENKLIDKKLKDRFDKFFVFDIDTSYPPLNPDTSPSLVFHLLEAYHTGFRASQAAEQNMWSLYVNDLQRMTGNKQTDAEYIYTSSKGSVIKGEEPTGKETATGHKRYNIGFKSEEWSWFRVRNGERPADCVPTSWYLDGADRAKVYSLAVRDDVRATLKQAARQYLALAMSKPIKPSAASGSK